MHAETDTCERGAAAVAASSASVADADGALVTDATPMTGLVSDAILVR